MPTIAIFFLALISLANTESARTCLTLGATTNQGVGVPLSNGAGYCYPAQSFTALDDFLYSVEILTYQGDVGIDIYSGDLPGFNSSNLLLSIPSKSSADYNVYTVFDFSATPISTVPGQRYTVYPHGSVTWFVVDQSYVNGRFGGMNPAGECWTQGIGVQGATTGNIRFNCVPESTENCPYPSPLATSNPPTMVPLSSGTTGFLSPNILTLKWNWPFVQTRSSPVVTFLTNQGNSSNPLIPATGCNFPAPSLSPPPVSDCLQILTVELPWTETNPDACGFTKTTTATPGVGSDDDIWTGYIRLSATESVSVITKREISNHRSNHSAGRSDVNRTVDNTFEITISFQNYASVSTSIFVAAPVNVTAAIISQEFGTTTPGVGTVQFVMQVAYPFLISLPTEGPIDTITGVTPAATALTTVSTSLASAIDSFSSSTFKLTITPSASMCTLSGQYATNSDRFLVQCTPSAISEGHCPELLDTGAGITFTIASSSFCAQVVENVGVTLSMNSFSDAEFENQSSAFIIQPNGHMYFLVSVQSSPKVSVTGLSVNQVVISSPNLPGGQLVLFDSFNSNPAITSDGATFLFNESPFTLPSGVHDGFSIGGVPNWNVLQDSLDTATVQAHVTVSYIGVGKKRSLEEQSSRATQVSTTANVVLASKNSSSPMVHSIVIFLIFVILLVEV